MQLTADLIGMIAALVADRGDDWGTRLIAADAAAEAMDFELEAALRWCVRNKKWPRREKAEGFGHKGLSWHWASARTSGRNSLPQNLDRWLGPGGYHDPDLAALLRRTGEGLFALEIV